MGRPKGIISKTPWLEGKGYGTSDKKLTEMYQHGCYLACLHCPFPICFEDFKPHFTAKIEKLYREGKLEEIQEAYDERVL